MIRTITIENFKSIARLDLELGRVNVLIGENGCGKTNLLEAIAFGGAAAADRLDNELLAPRGIRSSGPRFMRSAFDEESQSRDIRIAGSTQASDAETSETFEFQVRSDGHPTFPQWSVGSREEPPPSPGRATDAANRQARRLKFIAWFRIYAPENSSLRGFQDESQVFPFGVTGVGLFAYLKALNASPDRDRLDEIVERLTLLDWFERLEIPKDLAAFERRIDIRDRYLAQGALFDQRSANEGFLFLLFYFTLLISPDTPAFFAIDNIDAALNPKLCTELMRQIVELAAKHGKQVILTTHNPAVLDGLDLHDDEQRLFTVYRDLDGKTTVRRIAAPRPIDGAPTVTLSEAFVRGYIGGLPENF
jgi:predicted ATPase